MMEDSLFAGQTPSKSRQLVKRQESMRVSLNGEMKVRLYALAEKIGVPPATLATVALGLYVTQQEQTLTMQTRVIEAMADKVGGEIGGQLKLMLEQEQAKADQEKE